MALALPVPKGNPSSAVALQGDDDERLPDLDMDKITDLDVAKKIIVGLRREGRREQDYQQRLRRKLTKLDEALAARREEVESTQRTLQLEKGKEQSEKESAKREGGAKEKNQQESILKALSEVLYTKQTNSVGSKVVREYELDTVLVTYVRGKFRYPLNFRINEDTTVKTLRASACKYWGMKDPEQFILKTMANNKCQDEVKVKECFKQGELAQLRLAQKMVENSTEPTEDEKKAIQPKGGKKKKGRDGGFDPAGADKQQKFSENYFSELKKFGGVYYLLRARDQKPSDLASKVKFLDIIVYITLAILSFYVYDARRPPGHEYWFIRGIEEQIVNTRGSAYSYDAIPRFTDVQRQDEVWDWLTYTLPAQLWSVPSTRVVSGQSTGVPSKHDHTINGYNLLLGFLSIRAQNVKTEGCEDGAGLCASLGCQCYARRVANKTAETAEMTSVSRYWSNLERYNTQIRCDEAAPGRWVSADENFEKFNIADTVGRLESYDASGYSMQYQFDVLNPVTGLQQVQEDLRKLRELDWITLKTRVVIVSFTLFNVQYDEWLWCELMFEMPPSGGVYPSYVLRPFNPAISETKAEADYWYIDCVRLIIAMYVLIFVGYAERRHKIRNHKAGCWYHASLSGVCDLGLVSCLLCLVIWRSVEFEKGNMYTLRYMEQAQARGDDLPIVAGQVIRGFRSYADKAFDYETVFCIEGLLMLFLMFRMMSFTRLNYYVQIMKHTMGRSLPSFALLCAIFVPALSGFIFIMHTVFGQNHAQYALISRTMIQFYKLGTGGLSFTTLFDSDAAVTVFLLLLWFSGVSFILLNAFACVVVDTHYLVKLQTGNREHWDRRRWLTWAMPSLMVNVFNQVKQALFPDKSLDAA